MAKKKEKSKQDHAATSNTKVAMLGAGKMGGILLQAFLNKGLFRPENIRATVQHPERAAALPSSGEFLFPPTILPPRATAT